MSNRSQSEFHSMDLIGASVILIAMAGLLLAVYMHEEKRVATQPTNTFVVGPDAIYRVVGECEVTKIDERQSIL